uniref:Uncharacterized protein n=1 Tax=Panagrolaimus davidi TaxID=227884 RepID=A0A914QRH0_9BILA
MGWNQTIDGYCITSRNRKRKSKNSMIVSCKRAKFMAKYQRQNFSIPDSVIFYIAKNPKTAELYLKMVKTCKYFFVKNPIIIIPVLHANCGKWRSGYLPLNLTKYDSRYWITDSIYASAFEFVDKNIFSPIIPKLYQCDAESLFFSDQIISYHDLSLLISSAELISFTNVVVKYADCSDVPLEDILAIAANAKYVSATKPTITSKTMKELTKLPNFMKLVYFTLYNLSEVFDIDEFYGYMKKISHTKFFLAFDEQISEGYMNRLETIVDEILETVQFNYKPPVINFTALHREKFEQLRQICNSY